MKIAIVTLFNPFEKISGGIESVVYHQGKAFARLKHEVWIVTMGNVQKDTRTNVEGINLWILPDRKIKNLAARSLLFIRKGKPIVEKIERELEIDVFNGQGGLSGPLFFANLKSAKISLTVHTLDGENIASIKDCWRVSHYRQFVGEALKYPVLKAWRSFFFWRADALIFVSKFALNEFRVCYPYLRYKPCHVIENGFPDVSNADSFLGKKGFDFVYVGRIDKIKGVDLIIKAAHLLRKRYSFKIAVVGDGPWKRNIQNLATRLNLAENFHFFGHLHHSSMLEILSKTRCLILPSFYESDPLIFKESMAFGMPIICSDIPSLKTRITNLENGLTFRCGDYEDLAKAMQSFLSLREEGNTKTSVAARELADVRSWEQVAKDYLKVFGSLIKD